jgi:hypothetical protein
VPLPEKPKHETHGDKEGDHYDGLKSFGQAALHFTHGMNMPLPPPPIPRYPSNHNQTDPLLGAVVKPFRSK